MRTFELFRMNDETGISGTGKVLEGVVFSDGTVVTRWVSYKSAGRCTSFWPDFGGFLAIHVNPHPDNNTRIIFNDGAVIYHKDGRLIEKPPRKERRAKK